MGNSRKKEHYRIKQDTVNEKSLDMCKKEKTSFVVSMNSLGEMVW